MMAEFLTIDVTGADRNERRRILDLIDKAMGCTGILRENIPVKVMYLRTATPLSIPTQSFPTCLLPPAWVDMTQAGNLVLRASGAVPSRRL
jgi:hypothetical protein